MSQQLSVVRAVHYTPPGGEGGPCMAAVVTSVTGDDPTLATLTVFYPPQVRLLQPPGLVKQRDGERPQGDTWHWPERT